MSEFKNADRSHNPWPQLFYHDVYILDGGYARFYSLYPVRHF